MPTTTERPNALQRRLAVALIGLSLAATVLVGLAFWLAEARVESESLTALRSQASTGDYRRMLSHDRAARSARERKLVPVLLVTLLIIALLAWWAAGRLSSRTLEPVERLLAQIRALDPERRGARLAVTQDTELGVVAEALNAYMTRLDALVERERAFAAAASHELRTPLAVIGGAAELLRAGPAGRSPALGRIERAVASARDDLDALLALSRGGGGPEQPLQLEKCLPRWAEPYLVDACEIDWQLQSVALRAPAGLLAIVFTNLLRNALRAARQRITIRLQAGFLEIEDDGAGIAQDELSRIFEPHYSGRDGGSGIGLYICRVLTRDRGWLLQIGNREQGGVRARLRFGNV